MDYKKRRSSLRKVVLADVGQTDTRNLKRRSISFSGKNSVRVFHGEEEPKTWNNSYEISDHANCKSVMSSTRDLINVSYQNENSKIYQIGNSVDITLHEGEIMFQGAKAQKINQSNTELFSIPLEDHEKEVRTILPDEETIDYMSLLKNTSHSIENGVSNQKSHVPLHELVYKDQYHDSTGNKSANTKIPITVYINDSLSISCNESISDSNVSEDNKKCTIRTNDMQLSFQKSRQHDKENRSPNKRENLFQASAIQFSPNNAQQCKKENESTCAIQNANETNYKAVNVEKESFVFQNKINQLQEYNENMLMLNISECKDMKATSKIPTASLNHFISIENKNHPRIYFDQEIKTSPVIKHINCKEKKFLENIKYRPLLKNTKISIGLLLQSKKEEEHNMPLDIDLDESTIAEETKKDLSLNFSLHSAKNMSLSPESSSPLIPFEFNGYSLKQLNDEIENGKLKVFFNTANIPSTDHSIHLTGSTLHSKQRKIPMFKDENIPIFYDDSLHTILKTDKSNELLCINTTKENTAKETKTNSNCHYSHANEFMLENTSFLTRAKLSDETLFCNSSKRDLTQVIDLANISDGSSIEAAIKLEATVGSSLKSKKTCNLKNVALTSVFKNHIQEPTEAIRSKKDRKSFMSLYDTMDISYEIEKKLGNDVNDRQHYFLLQTEEFEKRSRRTTFFKNDDIVYNVLNEEELPEYAKNQQTLLYSNKCDEKKNILKFEKDCMKIETYFNNRTPLGNEFMKIGEQNIQNNKTEECVDNACPSNNKMHFRNEILLEKFSVRTKGNLCFDNEIPLDTESITIAENPLQLTPIDIEENIEVEETDKETCNLNLFNNKISLENILIESTEKDQTDETLYLNHKTLIEHENSQAVKCGTSPQNQNKARKTLFFNMGNCELEETFQVKNKKIFQSWEDAHISQDTDVTLNGSKVENASDIENQHKNKDQLMELTFNELDTNKNDIIRSDAYTSGRKSLYTPEFMNLTLAEKVNKNTNLFQELQTVNMTTDNEHPVNNVVDAVKYKKCDQNSEIFSLHRNLMEDGLKSLVYKYNNEMPNDHSLRPAEPLTNLVGTYSVEDKFKLINKQQKPLTTPMKSAGDVINCGSIYMTPRLSLLEFTALEKKIREEERIQSAKYLSPFRIEQINNKRLSANLTPAVRMSKKRQTLIFDECLLDESTISNSINSSLKKLTNSKENAGDLELNVTKKEPVCFNKSGTSVNKAEISGIIPKESILKTPPKATNSFIQMAISKGHNDVSPRNTSSNNYKDFKLDIEHDNLAESIQIVRRAITSTMMSPHRLAAAKPSIYNDNPIIISDVSEIFEIQRQSVIPQTEMSLNLDKTDKSMLASIQNQRKDFQNRYISLTLEDIEKTGLSLVQLSYEDNSILEQEDNAIEKCDISHFCRKCKRFQKTIFNETTSSSSESLASLGLSPVPELGLDRLRRLRSRPTIADVNVLWQRVSLDRTMIDVLNRSEYDCQTLAVLHETKDKNSTVTKCIRKYENDLIRFEIQFLEVQQNKATAEKLPFVLRLYSLLSANQNDWIFDYQMQSRGKLLFTHKKILTFTLLFTFDEVDPLGHKISLKSITLEKSNVPIKNWKPIDFVLDFQLKLILPFNLQLLCKGENEAAIFRLLQEINGVCLDTIKTVNCLQRISFTNGASIIRDEWRTYVRKMICKTVQNPGSDFKYVKKTEIKVELLNLKKLSFKDIVSPPLHQFREDIHLLPTGLQFLQEFLKSPLNYLNSY